MSDVSVANTATELMVSMAVNAWKSQVKNFDKYLLETSEQTLLQEVAPGRNTGIYLLGHLTSVADGMFPLLDFRGKMQPELEPIFVTSPDKSGNSYPTGDTIKMYWKAISEELAKYMDSMSAEQWLERHTAVSEEDFKKEPHRNKLNVLLSRTNHQSYHFGQLKLLPNL